MDKSEKLKSAILSNYKSIREFSKIVDIPNSTIVSALDNGIGGMAVDKVIKICDVLNLDIKTFDKLTNTLSADALSKNEMKLIGDFNKLNGIGQHEASKRVEELTYIDKYKKDLPDYIKPVAAHLEGELTEEQKKIIDEF